MPMNRHPISGQEAAADVRSGMSDRDLMTKYHLSATGLLNLFSKLVQAGMLTEAEVADRLAPATAEIDVDLAKPLIEAEPIPGAPVLKWKFKTHGWVFSSPVIAANAVFFGSWDGHLYSVDCGSGHLNWKFRTGDVIRSSPAYMQRHRVHRKLGQIPLCN